MSRYNKALMLRRQIVYKLHTKVEGKLEAVSFLLLINGIYLFSHSLNKHAVSVQILTLELSAQRCF